jgi:hypothetical protein
MKTAAMEMLGYGWFDGYSWGWDIIVAALA